jgi:hypothetical protein
MLIDYDEYLAQRTRQQELIERARLDRLVHSVEQPPHASESAGDLPFTGVPASPTHTAHDVVWRIPTQLIACTRPA